MYYYFLITETVCQSEGELSHFDFLFTLFLYTLHPWQTILFKKTARCSPKRSSSDDKVISDRRSLGWSEMPACVLKYVINQKQWLMSDS